MAYDDLTLREKILKTFVVTIREINMHGGPCEFFEKYPVGGLYYSGAALNLDENGDEIGTAFKPETLSECRKYSKNKLLVCADLVSIPGQKIRLYPHNSIRASHDLQDAYEWGKIIGMQMNSQDVDWVLGPIIDMEFDYVGHVTTLSENPVEIANISRNIVKGIQEQGVCATVKHFPGLKTGMLNMHMAPVNNGQPFDEWMETYGYLYKEMFKEDVKSVMTTHVSLGSYDDQGENGFYPIATYSSKLTTELLKTEMGFEGAVVTDALIMGGMATGDLVAETVQAFKAGADLLLWPPVEAADKIEELIQSGEIPMSRLEDALSRIEKMEQFRAAAVEKKSFDDPDAKYADEKLLKFTKKGICLLKNDCGLLPLSKENYPNVLIVDTTDGDVQSVKLLKGELDSRGFCVDIKKDIFDVPSEVCWQSDIDKLQAEYDLIIFFVNTKIFSRWDDAHMLIWCSHLFDKKKKLIINYGSPYFADYVFPEDPTIIEANCSPTTETIEMLVAGMLGEYEFTGESIIRNPKKWRK